jgi:predicted DNA-binding protein (MmcQ/YjbR family)
VREAYEKVAPPALTAKLGKTIEIAPPTKPLSAAEIDPMQAKGAQAVLKVMRRVCLALPETAEDKQFGFPVWRAGKKTFAQAYQYRSEDRLKVAFWVGVEQQAMLTGDERYDIPKYMGHNGWIALDVSKHLDQDEVRGLALFSYRHFASKRMLKQLDQR